MPETPILYYQVLENSLKGIMLKRHYCHDDDYRRRLIRCILLAILALVGLILLIIILILIILRPTKPSFTLRDADLCVFNLSSSSSTTAEPPCPVLNITMQATFSAHNPNDRIGVFYRSLDVYVSYRDQQVSRTVSLPPSYQHNNDITVWSPLLYGIAVPVPAYTADALCEDQNTGAVMLKVVVEGDIKWKVGSWVSGTYKLHVNCPAYIRLAHAHIDMKQSCGVDV